MEKGVLIIYAIILIVLGVFNVYIFRRTEEKKEQINDKSQLLIRLSLIDKKITALEEILDSIDYKIDLLELKTPKGMDELSAYVEQGMNIQDIAKKKNISVKEVELMMKLRDKQ